LGLGVSRFFSCSCSVVGLLLRAVPGHMAHAQALVALEHSQVLQRLLHVHEVQGLGDQRDLFASRAQGHYEVIGRNLEARDEMLFDHLDTSVVLFETFYHIQDVQF